MSAKKTNVVAEPTVRIFLPLVEETGAEVTVDQTENVIINGKVTLPVFGRIACFYLLGYVSTHQGSRYFQSIP